MLHSKGRFTWTRIIRDVPYERVFIFIKFIRSISTMARFPRRYGANELNQCKQKTIRHGPVKRA